MEEGDILVCTFGGGKVIFECGSIRTVTNYLSGLCEWRVFAVPGSVLPLYWVCSESFEEVQDKGFLRYQCRKATRQEINQYEKMVGV